MRFRISIFLFFFFASYSQACLLENGMSSVYLSAFEDLEPGKSIGHLPIQGSTSGESPEISLKVVKGGDLVEIDPGTKNLLLKSELDRDEGASKFEAVVECKSSNDDSDFSQLNISVFVTIKDVNDNAPEFDSEEYNITVKEELPIGTIVFTDFEATDVDQPGPNSFVQYSIVPGKYSHLLQIADPFKPVVTVKNRIDFESLKSFEVLLEARDQGEPSLSTTAPLRVKVENTNDLNPYFSHLYYTARSVKNGQLVMEPEPIKAKDGDDLNASILYKLEGELSSEFSIDSNGSIRVRSNPPPKKATFFVIAYEMENADRNATAVVVVDMEPAVQFEHHTYSTIIHEATPPGTMILHAKASSRKPTDKISYTLIGESSGLDINEITGNVYVNEELEEGVLQYNISAITAQETTTVPLTVIVNGGEECGGKLEFEKQEYHLQLGSLPVLGKIKLRGEAQAKYKLMNMNKDFVVDSSGAVRLRAGARPQCATCELIVVASDDEGSISVAKVIVKNSAYSMSTSSALTIMILILLTLIFSILLIIVCRKIHYAWRSHKRANICWMNNTNDTGVTISGTMSTPSRYVVNSEKERAFEAQSKSPAPKRAQGAHLVPVTVTNQDGAPTVYF